MRHFILAVLAAATLTLLMAQGACLAAPADSGGDRVQWAIYRQGNGGHPYPPRVAKLVSEGMALMTAGKWQASIAKYNAALKLMPDGAGLYQNRGMSRLGAGEPDAALTDFNKALSLDPDMAPIIYWNRGDCYKAMDKPKLAVAEYTRALALNPGPEQRARMLLSRGRLLVDLSQPERAEQDFQQVTAYPQLAAQAYSELSYLATQRGDVPACIALAGRAIEADPKFFDGWMNRSTCEIATQKYDAALRDLNAAIQLDPERPEAYLNRAGVHVALHECREAKADAEKVAKLLTPAYEQMARKLIEGCR